MIEKITYCVVKEELLKFSGKKVVSNKCILIKKKFQEKSDCSNIQMVFLQGVTNLIEEKKFEEALECFADNISKISYAQRSIYEEEIVILAEVVSTYCDDAYFLQVLQLYPQHPKLLFLYACILLRVGKLPFARRVTEKSLSVYPTDLRLLDLQERIRFKSVDRWHFRMLNDKVRNQCYYNAISRKISGGCKTVLDIGCGTGVLSIFATALGAKLVYACESSQILCSVAKDTICWNKCNSSIRLFCGESFQLNIPDTVPERVDLIISEIFDGGLLGENCLEVFEDAITRFGNVSYSSLIIPYRATFYVVGVSSLKIRNENRAVINDGALYSNVTDAPYNLEFLNPEDFECITDELKLFQVDFRSLDSIRSCQNYSDNISVKCIKDGLIDAFVGWFTLELDEVETLTNSPGTESCWEQAIFPTRKLVNIQKNDCLPLLVNILKGNKSHFVTIKVDRDDEVLENKLFASSLLVHRLNDPTLMNYIKECLNYLQQIQNKNSIVKVLLLSTSFLVLENDVNGVDFFVDSCVDVLFSKSFARISREQAIKADLRFDLIVTELVRESGTLSPEGFQNLEFWRSHLSTGGICLTRRLVIYILPVRSKYLELNSRVHDPVLFTREDLKFSNSINEYKTSHFEDIDLSSIDILSFSIPKKALILEYDEFYIDKYTSCKFKVNKKGQLDAFLYWFETKSFSNVSFNTRNSRSFKKAAYIVDPVEVEEGDVLNISVRYSPGYLNLKLISVQKCDKTKN
ncbi:protein arginine N-methyltransferase 7-like isoform X1 [Artemia franciscana]|uniref:protein arginine N-methyltransferase 7-like isoform X1 n=2 Tax=Artemia franciscana TaxID=6661 RepID=UPI0032DA9464